MTHDVAMLRKGLESIAIALEQLGGNAPLAIDIDTDTLIALKMQDLGHARVDGPRGELTIDGVLFRVEPIRQG